MFLMGGGLGENPATCKGESRRVRMSAASCAVVLDPCTARSLHTTVSAVERAPWAARAIQWASSSEGKDSLSPNSVVELVL